MTCKYIVEDLNTNKKFEFYTVSKIDTNSNTVKTIIDGLKEGKTKYDELIKEYKTHKIVFIKLYPNYRNGEMETEIIATNV